MDQWTVTVTYHCTPDDGRVTPETYVVWTEQKYENKKCIHWLKYWKLLYELNRISLRSDETAGDIYRFCIINYLWVYGLLGCDTAPSPRP
jgi:hypothetical protein